MDALMAACIYHQVQVATTVAALVQLLLQLPLVLSHACDYQKQNHT
jgi:hypothetical protein